jgi:hypothetical protein
MRAMELQDKRQLSPELPLGDSGDPRLMALAYALHVLNDPRQLVDSQGTLTDLLEANAISFREVRTPPDLLHRSRTVLVLLRQADASPVVVHRRGGKTQIYDPQEPGGPQILQEEPNCKPFAYELYAGWPSGVRGAKNPPLRPRSFCC